MASHVRRAIIALSEAESKTARTIGGDTVGVYRVSLSGYWSGEKSRDFTVSGDQLFRIADILAEGTD